MMRRHANNRMRPRIAMCRCLQAFFGIALAVSLAAAAHKPKKEDGPTFQISKAPPSALLMKNPFSGEVEALSAGQKLFHKNCMECHGPDGRGRGHAADLHSPVIQNAPPGVLFWGIQNGRPRKGMPPWSQLTDEQLWELVTYIKALEQPAS